MTTPRGEEPLTEPGPDGRQQVVEPGLPPVGAEIGETRVRASTCDQLVGSRNHARTLRTSAVGR